MVKAPLGPLGPSSWPNAIEMHPTGQAVGNNLNRASTGADSFISLREMSAGN